MTTFQVIDTKTILPDLRQSGGGRPKTSLNTVAADNVLHLCVCLGGGGGGQWDVRSGPLFIETSNPNISPASPLFMHRLYILQTLEMESTVGDKLQ